MGTEQTVGGSAVLQYYIFVFLVKKDKKAFVSPQDLDVLISGCLPPYFWPSSFEPFPVTHPHLLCR